MVVIGVSIGLSLVGPTGFLLVGQKVSVGKISIELVGMTTIGVIDVCAGN